MKPIPQIEEIIKFYPEFEGVHPLADAFPMKSEDEFWELVEHIRENGVAYPLLKEKGTNLLVDGRARLLALDITGSLFEVEETDPEFVLAHLTASNLHAKSLTSEESAQVKAKLDAYRQQGDRDKTPNRQTPEPDSRELIEAQEQERQTLMAWHREWGIDAVPLRVIGFQNEEAR